MPVCIAGMHRSGTSMIARMLNICGLNLGAEEELYPAQPDNTEGFWEHKRFQDLNIRLLERRCGAWDKVPAAGLNWHLDPALDDLRQEARSLIAEFEGKGHWGWKDPRSSLNLPFWKLLIPDLKVLVAVRNPVDVAASLSKRGYASELFGLELWGAYAAASEPDLQQETTLYTHYETYFVRARQELERIAPFCGLSPTPKQLDDAAATVSAGLRHSHSTLVTLLGAMPQPGVVREYVQACALSGEVYQSISDREWLDLTHLADGSAVRERDEQLAKLAAKLKAEREQTAAHRVARLRANAEVVDAHRKIGQLTWEIGDVRSYLARVESELRSIQGSTAWAIARRIGKIAPEGSVVNRGLRKLRRSLGGPAPLPIQADADPQPQPKRIPKGKPDPIVELGLNPEPIPVEGLAKSIRAALKNSEFALAISHDSIQVFTGGIQTVIHDERRRLLELGVSQLHVCPAKLIQKLSDDETSLPLLLTADGQALGIAETRDLIAALGELGGCQSVQLHHTINWNLSLLGELLDSLPNAPKHFWLHDYYTVCESYNLLRNDRAFCYAPPLSSNSCEICRHGPGRAKHLPAYKQFLARWPFTFHVPSQIAAEIWLKAYQEHKDRLRVSPIYSLSPTEEPNSRNYPANRKLKIAFPGISWDYKGWSHWRKLVDALVFNPNYELVHLGQVTEEFQHSYLPERFREIKSNALNTQALVDALVEEQVDIVFYCPIWYETFSLIAHEAHASGCWTLTIEESGNVAVYVRNSESGIVFENSDVLITYLLDVAQVREDLEAFQERTPMLSRLKYNSQIVDELYLPQAAKA